MPRLVEIVIAAVALALLAPLLAVVALAVRLSSPGPVIYRQTRVGRGGELFVLLKFRTMTNGADAEGQLTVGADRRVTAVGRRLRDRRLDELPQLVNVLKGDMSLVGARPEVPEYLVPELSDQQEVLRHRPGLTDPASLAYRDEAALLAAAHDPVEYYRRELLPAKVAMSAAYLRRRSAWSDVGVVLRTVWCLFGRSAQAAP